LGVEEMQMITVRFPSGFSVRYNDMAHVSWVDKTAYLYASKASVRENGVGWKVRVPEECIIEFIEPCRTYDACQSPELEAEITRLRQQIKSPKPKKKSGSK
jgi:hypothetical protein